MTIATFADFNPSFSISLVIASTLVFLSRLKYGKAYINALPFEYFANQKKTFNEHWLQNPFERNKFIYFTDLHIWYIHCLCISSPWPHSILMLLHLVRCFGFVIVRLEKLLPTMNTASESWLKAPRYHRWGFEAPSEDPYRKPEPPTDRRHTAFDRTTSVRRLA